MKTEERRSERKKAAEAWSRMSCCGADAGPARMPDWFRSVSETRDCSTMMGNCMKMCRWFPIVPVVLGIACLLLGYYLDASITRVLWISVAGFVALMGALCLIFASRMAKMCRAAESKNRTP